MRYDLGYPQVDKIYDIFSSSESSAMFGNVAQKQGIQQDRAIQFLRSIGVMIKELFPLVRELRVLDERMELYKNWDKSKSADITLKQHYVQFVEQGGQNHKEAAEAFLRGYRERNSIFLSCRDGSSQLAVS